ncbi:MAG: ribonuclease P protein component [Minisyncoccia bacterium]
MLPRHLRIKRGLYKELILGSRFVHSPHFTLRYIKIEGQKSKVGVSVSKKVAKSAVTRNTVRRRVYDCVSPYLEKYKQYLLLVVAKSGAQFVKGEKLNAEIKQLFLEL